MSTQVINWKRNLTNCQKQKFPLSKSAWGNVWSGGNSWVHNSKGWRNNYSKKWEALLDDKDMILENEWQIRWWKKFKTFETIRNSCMLLEWIFLFINQTLHLCFITASYDDDNNTAGQQSEGKASGSMRWMWGLFYTFEEQKRTSWDYHVPISNPARANSNAHGINFYDCHDCHDVRRWMWMLKIICFPYLKNV